MADNILKYNKKLFTSSNSNVTSGFLTIASAQSTYVPYTGATANVNLGSFALTTIGNISANTYTGIGNTNGALANSITNGNTAGFTYFSVNNDINKAAALAVFGTTGAQGTLYTAGSAWLSLVGTKTGIVNEEAGGELVFANGGTGSASEVFKINTSNNIELYNGKNIVLNTITGSKIGTATNQKLGFYNTTPVIQQTNSITGATTSAGGGNALNDLDTWDGYTIGKLVRALRATGIIA